MLIESALSAAKSFFDESAHASGLQAGGASGASGMDKLLDPASSLVGGITNSMFSLMSMLPMAM